MLRKEPLESQRAVCCFVRSLDTGRVHLVVVDVAKSEARRPSCVSMPHFFWGHAEEPRVLGHTLVYVTSAEDYSFGFSTNKQQSCRLKPSLGIRRQNFARRLYCLKVGVLCGVKFLLQLTSKHRPEWPCSRAHSHKQIRTITRTQCIEVPDIRRSQIKKTSLKTHSVRAWSLIVFFFPLQLKNNILRANSEF